MRFTYHLMSSNERVFYHTSDLLAPTSSLLFLLCVFLVLAERDTSQLFCCVGLVGDAWVRKGLQHGRREDLALRVVLAANADLGSTGVAVKEVVLVPDTPILAELSGVLTAKVGDQLVLVNLVEEFLLGIAAVKSDLGDGALIEEHLDDLPSACEYQTSVDDLRLAQILRVVVLHDAHGCLDETLGLVYHTQAKTVHIKDGVRVLNLPALGVAARHHDVALEYLVGPGEDGEHDVLFDFRGDLIDIDFTVAFNVDRPTVLGNATIAVRIEFSELRSQLMLWCSHDCVDRVLLTVLLVVYPHYLDLLEVKLAGSAELQQVRISEPRVSILISLLQEGFELDEDTFLPLR